MHEQEQGGTEFFGPDHTWTRLYELTFSHIQYRFGMWGRAEDLEDAASEGFQYVMQKWVTYPSSLSDDLDRNWNYAKRIARLQAAEWLRKATARPEVAVSTLVPLGLSPEQEADFIDHLYGEDPLHIEENAVERDLRERAAAVIAEVDDKAWTTWFEDLVVLGLTEPAAAQRHGVTHQAIAQRRACGLAKLRPLLRKHGLIEEEANV